MMVKNIGAKAAVFLLFFGFFGNLYAQDKITNFSGGNEQQTPGTISIYGIGTVLAQPDTIQMTISLHKTDKTTRLAQQEVSKMVRRVLSILKENNVEDKKPDSTEKCNTVRICKNLKRGLKSQTLHRC